MILFVDSRVFPACSWASREQKFLKPYRETQARPCCPSIFRYHCMKGWASICTIVFFKSVFVRTSSLLVAL